MASTKEIKASVRKQIEDEAQLALNQPMHDLTAPSDEQRTTRFRQVVNSLLRDPDARVRLATLELLLNYGYGKPVQQTQAKVEATQTFVAEVPPVEDAETWMRNWGNKIVQTKPSNS